MSQSTSAYFSNSAVGVPDVAGDFDIYEVSTTPKFVVGTKIERQDGAVFRYACVGIAVSRGRLVAPDYQDSAAFGYSANAVIATSSTYQQDVERTGLYPGMKGSRYVVITYTTTTANDLAGGYLTISSGTGLGHTYRIKGNKVSSGTACTIQLADPIAIGLDATADIAIAPCKYTRLTEACAGAQSSDPVGVSVVAVTTASPFCFIQTKGMVGVAWSGIGTAGTVAALSETDVGFAEQWNGGISTQTGSYAANILSLAAPIGRLVIVTATSGHAMIDLNLE